MSNIYALSTEEEKKIGTLEYNHSLFESMAAFSDVVWEINAENDTVYIIQDRLTPVLEKRQISMDELRPFVIERSHPKYKDIVSLLFKREHLLNINEKLVNEMLILVGNTYHTIRYSVTPVKNEYDKSEIVYISAQDIQEILDKQEVKVKGQVELDKYLTSIPCGILQYTRDTQKILYVNDTALEILGYSSMEEMQQEGFDGVVKSVYNEDSEKMKTMIKSIRSEDDVEECEHRVRHKDGKELTCIGKIRIIERGKEEPIVQRSMVDITSMRKTAIMHKQVADTLAVANMGLWYFILDEGEPKFFVDEIVARLIGTSVNETPERAYTIWYDTLTPDVKETVNEAVVKMRNGHPAEVTYSYNHPSRGKIVIRCGGFRDMSYKGKGMLIRGYHQDISEYNKKLLEQIEISKAVLKYYKGVCEIDLKNSTSTINSSVSDDFSGFIANERPIEAVLDTLSKSVLDESKDFFRKISDIDYLREKLNNEDSFIVKLLMDIGELKLTFVVTTRDELGIAEKCVLFVEG